MLTIILYLSLTSTVLSLPSEYPIRIDTLLKNKIDSGADILNKGIEFGNKAVQLVEGLKADGTQFLTDLTNGAISAGVNLSSQGLDGATGLASQALEFLNLFVQLVGCPFGRALTEAATNFGRNKLHRLNEFGQTGLNAVGGYIQTSLQGVNNLAQRKYGIISKLSDDSSLLGQTGVKAGAEAVKSMVDVGSSAVNRIRNVISLNG
uniref:Venom hemolysin-like protein 11 n=1 Tax=Pristhesancus plagipennis TaxID=1955184 RepID=A0A2K8JM04_PRIPG|nr:venom hemolysin-like protein 11 [Pristhesancus plagipennis]